VATKRRLPLLQPAADEPDSRPRWQWIAFGALATFVVWLPLSALTAMAAARWSTRAASGEAPGVPAAYAAASVVALSAAAWAGGFTIGKWGDRGLGARDGALAGLAAAAVAVVASALSFGFVAGSLLIAAVAAPLGAFGAHVGKRWR
jgi:hypothetical protein